MEKLIKQWEQKLKIYQSAIDASSHERDKSFHKGKKAAMEIAIEELKNFISFNLPVSGSLPFEEQLAKEIGEMTDEEFEEGCKRLYPKGNDR